MKPNHTPPADSSNLSSMSENLGELKTQISGYRELIEKIICELKNVPDGTAIDIFQKQVIKKQAYLESLLDETTCELDLLKRDVFAIVADLQEVKQEVAALRPTSAPPQPAMQKEDSTSTEHSILAAIRSHPLSSIPPRHLSETEALSFLKEIDSIVTKRSNSEVPEPYAIVE